MNVQQPTTGMIPTKFKITEMTAPMAPALSPFWNVISLLLYVG
jgi:hypothetical protein